MAYPVRQTLPYHHPSLVTRMGGFYHSSYELFLLFRFLKKKEYKHNIMPITNIAANIGEIILKTLLPNNALPKAESIIIAENTSVL
jgi:hypothetical protein